MNTAEVYRNIQKTTAEIQNYYETKLDRDANSKDSGISQMGGNGGGGGGGDQQYDHFMMSSSTTTLMAMTPSKDRANGHHHNNHGLNFDRDDFCNGDSLKTTASSTATTTKSNTPENAVRLDSIDGNGVSGSGGVGGGGHHRGNGLGGVSEPTFTVGDDGRLIFDSMI